MITAFCECEMSIQNKTDSSVLFAVSDRPNIVFEPTTTSTTFFESAFSICAEWSFERVFIEIFLGVALLLNIFSTYVVFTTRLPKKTNSFIVNCTKVINISNIFTVLQLLFYPFLFFWNHLKELTWDERDNLIYMKNSSFETMFQPQQQAKINGNEDIHPCQQESELPCRISGFLFGLFLFFPLASLAVMNIDATLFAFRWKMHRFRPHTVSMLRLTLLIGSYFATAVLFALPAFGIGTRYRYHKFLKICWLSACMEDFVVQGFAYIICGFVSFLLLLTILFGYVVLQAYRAQQKSVNQIIGHNCTLLIGQYKIVTSRIWVTYARLILCLDAIAFVAYLPLSLGYLIRYTLLLAHVGWLNLLIEVAVLILPTITPFVSIGVCKPHLRRAQEIFGLCTRNDNYNQKVSPMMRPASTWSYQSSPLSNFGDRTLKIYGNNFMDKHAFGQKKPNFIQQRGVHLGVDSVRQTYQGQNEFSQLPTASYSTMLSNATISDFERENTIVQRKEQPAFLRHQYEPGKSYAERQRRFYAMNRIPEQVNMLSKLKRPVVSIRANRRTLKKYRRPRQFYKPQYGMEPRGKIIKRSQAMLPEPGTEKWKISNSFYADSFDDSIRSGIASQNMNRRRTEHVSPQRFYREDSFESSVGVRTPAVSTVERDGLNNDVQTINSSTYSFDDTQETDTFDRAFYQNFSQPYQRYRR